MMNTVLPISIVFLLGGVSGLVCHRVWKNFLRATMVAALSATVVWGAGVYVLLWTTAPNELGPPLPGPVLLTFVITSVPAALIVVALRHGAPTAQDPSSTEE